MSDRQTDRARLAGALSEPGGPVTLEDGIRRLETGRATPGLEVDLGNGQIARPDGPLGADGLLRRLKGFRVLMALAEGGQTLSALSLVQAPQIDPQTRRLLDALSRKR